jgi:hypothetical protein
MALSTIYVAFSRAMQEWGSDVGVGKHLYKTGLTDEDPKDVIKALNDEACAGQKDWALAGAREVEGLDAEAFAARLPERQKILDPLYYPKINGAKDIMKLEQRKIEANIVIKRTMEGRDSKVPKLTPALIADFLIDTMI